MEIYEKMQEYALTKKESTLHGTKITCSSDADRLARGFYYDDLEIYESMFVMFLNRANVTIGWVKLSQGGIHGTVVDVKLMAKYAVESLACGVIMVHNHPSGNVDPSDEDVKVTIKAKQALKLLDVNVLDHLVITKERYTSMSDEGLIPSI